MRVHVVFGQDKEKAGVHESNLPTTTYLQKGIVSQSQSHHEVTSVASFFQLFLLRPQTCQLFHHLLLFIHSNAEKVEQARDNTEVAAVL